MLRELTLVHIFGFNWFLIVGMGFFEVAGKGKEKDVWKEYKLPNVTSFTVLLVVEFFWIVGIVNREALSLPEATSLIAANSFVWGTILCCHILRISFYVAANLLLFLAVLRFPLNAGVVALSLGGLPILASVIRYAIMRRSKNRAA